MKKQIFGLLVAAVFALSNCSPKLRMDDVSQQFLNVKIDESAEGEPFGPCEPSIVISPADPMKMAAGAILDRHYWSENGGKTWQKGKLQSTYGVFGDPVLAADQTGNFYFMHLSDSTKKGWANDRLLDRIVVQKSTDGGRTYNDGSFMGQHHPHDQDKPWMCIDPRSGAIYVTWTEFDLYNSKKPEDHTRILFSASTDGGKSWSKALKINELDGNCLDDDLTVEGAVPAVGPNGEVYVSWSFDGKIWFDRSLDGGKTWLPKDIFLADQPGGWSFEIPGITRCNGMPVTVCDLSDGPNRGTIYVNWSDQRAGPNNTDIFISKSTDGGSTWSKPVRINSDKSRRHQFFNWLAIDRATGWLYSVFYDRRATKDLLTDVVVAVSKDGGAKWKNYRISDSPFEPQTWVFFGDYNNISAQNGHVRPIWTRLENGKLSVWTALLKF